MTLRAALPGPGELLHLSEDPSIVAFVPHVAATSPDPTPFVWAVDAEHAPAYWFPRACPRVSAWVGPSTTEQDRLAVLGGSATRVHLVEEGWLDRIRAAQVFAYRFAADAFEPYGRPGRPYAWVSRQTVVPSAGPEPLGDLVDLHAQAGIELRSAVSLWPWWDRVRRSSLDFSGVRLQNAVPREP